MKKNITLIIFIILGFLLGINYSYADISKCDNKNKYPLYECRVKELCKGYLKKTGIIYDTEDYKELGERQKDGLKKAKKKYREDMNNIYKCSILKVQKKSIESSLKLLKADKTGTLSKNIEKKLNKIIEESDKSFKKLECKGKNETYINDKIGVLNRTTYELCRYNNYLDYLRDYNSKIPNIIPENSNAFTINSINQKIAEAKNEIDNEISHSYRVFPMAYQAYNEYENNFPVHILLQVLREDFVVYRKKYYQAIQPINQFVYKLSNCMSVK